MKYIILSYFKWSDKSIDLMKDSNYAFFVFRIAKVEIH